MKHVKPSLFAAAAFTVALGSMTPTMAAPLAIPKTPVPSREIVQVQSEKFGSHRYKQRHRGETDMTVVMDAAIVIASSVAETQPTGEVIAATVTLDPDIANTMVGGSHQQPLRSARSLEER